MGLKARRWTPSHGGLALKSLGLAAGFDRDGVRDTLVVFSVAGGKYTQLCEFSGPRACAVWGALHQLHDAMTAPDDVLPGLALGDEQP